LICLEDGKHFKSLKRHLAAHGLTPEQYRAKWKLPYDYPMVVNRRPKVTPDRRPKLTPLFDARGR
jgi:predicted transcriptional regulator